MTDVQKLCKAIRLADLEGMKTVEIHTHKLVSLVNALDGLLNEVKTYKKEHMLAMNIQRQLTELDKPINISTFEARV